MQTGPLDSCLPIESGAQSVGAPVMRSDPFSDTVEHVPTSYCWCPHQVESISAIGLNQVTFFHFFPTGGGRVQRCGLVSCPLTLEMMNQFRSIALSLYMHVSLLSLSFSMYACVWICVCVCECVCVCLCVIADVALNTQLGGKQAALQIFNALIIS